MIKIKSDVKKTCAKGLLSVAIVTIPAVADAAYLYTDSYAFARRDTNPSFNSYSSSSSPVLSSSSSSGDRGSAISMAYADFGVLKISGDATALASSTMPADQVYANSTASWDDAVTISSQNASGMAYLTANILVRGSVVAGSNIYGYAYSNSDFRFTTNGCYSCGSVTVHGYSSVQVSANGAIHSHGYTLESADKNLASIDDMFRLYSFDIPFLLGANFGISVSLMGSTSASAGNDQTTPGFGFGSYDLGHSLYWAGISELRDANGNLITDYSLVSGSGVDYRNSLVPTSTVPVPASIWLFLSGLLAFGFTNKQYFDKNRHIYTA